MQTFLPLPDFKQSASVLDKRRLWKQVLEARQIFEAIHNPDYGWQNHAATEMWRGYTDALADYHNYMLVECLRRKINILYPFSLPCPARCAMPQWLGDELFHSSHRAALLYRKPRWYNQFGWTDVPDEDLVWPINPITGR